MNEPWRVALTPQSRRDLHRLPEKAAAAVIEAIEAIGANPQRLGKPLKLQLAGQWSARRGPYRVIYAIHAEERLVVITAIGHRADVYRPR